MSDSSKRSEDPGPALPPALDLARALPTTAADVAALRGLRESRRFSTEDYLAALARLAPLTAEQQAARRHAGGDVPFSL